MAEPTTSGRIYATGKRKTAVARVFMSPGTGKITVNKRGADEYFVRETSRMVMRQSLELIAWLTITVVPATHEPPPLARGEGNGHGFHHPRYLTKP